MCGGAAGLLTRGSLPRRLPGLAGQWRRGGGASPLTAAGPSRTCTGFPHRAPVWRRAYHRTVSSQAASRWALDARLWLPVVAWAAVIFAFSSVPASATGLGAWDHVLRKLAHARRVRGPRRAARCGRPVAPAVAFALGGAVRGQRRGAPAVRRRAATGSPLDVGDRRARRRRRRAPLAARLRGRRCLRDDRARSRSSSTALGDTRPLWHDWLAAAQRCPRPRPRRLPADRAEAAAAARPARRRNWRVLLERFAEDRAPVYLRRRRATSAALQRARSRGRGSASSPTRPRSSRGSRSRSSARTGACGGRDRRGRLERLLERLGADAESSATATSCSASLRVESEPWSARTRRPAAGRAARASRPHRRAARAPRTARPSSRRASLQVARRAARSSTSR